MVLAFGLCSYISSTYCNNGRQVIDAPLRSINKLVFSLCSMYSSIKRCTHRNTICRSGVCEHNFNAHRLFGGAQPAFLKTKQTSVSSVYCIVRSHIVGYFTFGSFENYKKVAKYSCYDFISFRHSMDLSWWLLQMALSSLPHPPFRIILGFSKYVFFPYYCYSC